jgi:hypothetical protein
MVEETENGKLQAIRKGSCTKHRYEAISKE